MNGSRETFRKEEKMAVRTSEELRGMVKGLIGDRTDDEAIGMIEDFTDTFNQPKDDWEEKYKENDAAWRKRYTERFFSGEPMPTLAQQSSQMTDPAPAQEPEAIVTYDQLFKEE